MGRAKRGPRFLDNNHYYKMVIGVNFDQNSKKNPISLRNRIFRLFDYLKVNSGRSVALLAPSSVVRDTTTIWPSHPARPGNPLMATQTYAEDKSKQKPLTTGIFF